MTCRAAGDREAGFYECRDVDGLARDSVVVHVARPTNHRRGITTCTGENKTDLKKTVLFGFMQFLLFGHKPSFLKGST